MLPSTSSQETLRLSGKQNKTKQNKTKQNKTKQKTKQNKTKQNKTKQNKTNHFPRVQTLSVYYKPRTLPCWQLHDFPYALIELFHQVIVQFYMFFLLKISQVITQAIIYTPKLKIYF
jgi:hypothetical protein